VAALMVYIILLTAYAHVMRHTQNLRKNIAWSGAIHYTAAALFCAGWWMIRSDARVGWEEAVYGMIAGAMSCCGYFFFNSGLRLAGVAITQSMGRLSIALPVVAAIGVWGEIPDALRSIGLALVLVSAPLLVRGNALRNVKRSKWKVPVLLIHFTTMGVMGVAFKAFRESVPGGTGPVFLTFFFGIAMLGSLPVAAAGTERPDKRDLMMGLILGALNLANKLALMLALVALPAIVVFPVSTAGIIILSTVASLILWKERYSRRAILGLVLAIIAIVLINLGGNG